MKRFTRLFISLDETNKTSAKLAALEAYFHQAPPRDAAWAVTYLVGRRPRTPVNAAQIRSWAARAADMPEWLFAECYQAVGDLAETVSLILPVQGAGSDFSLAHWVEERIVPLAGEDEDTKRRRLISWWLELGQPGRFVLTKLLTGAWRVGVSQRLVTRALAQALNAEPDVVAHRLMGHWQPSQDFYEGLRHPDTSDAEASRPYPFFLAYPLDDEPRSLGRLDDWLAEWKWDGVRTQLVKRQGEVHLWSRGEDLVTHRFPEVAASGADLPDGTVLDGEVLAWARDGQGSAQGVMPFSQLQRRLNRKAVGKKLLAEVPVILLAYDLLEWQGRDVRSRPLSDRRMVLEGLMGSLTSGSAIRLSPRVEAGSWEELAELRRESRDRNVEGFMLKGMGSTYGVGRKRGEWWKWKVDPYSADAVLIYAQRGSGRRASLYTDYTFGVWNGSELVPFAKAYSGLTDEEIREVDRFVRANTLERFGPVRSVRPELVMELHFEDIRVSKRHKSGIAVRFPRIVRWRRDKPPSEADTLETVKALLPPGENPVQETEDGASSGP